MSSSHSSNYPVLTLRKIYEVFMKFEISDFKNELPILVLNRKYQTSFDSLTLKFLLSTYYSENHPLGKHLLRFLSPEHIDLIENVDTPIDEKLIPRPDKINFTQTIDTPSPQNDSSNDDFFKSPQF